MNNNVLQTIGLCFDKSPEKAVEFLESKKLKVTWNWQEQLQAIKENSFTVAKVSSANVLQLFQNEIKKSMVEGNSYNVFKKNMKSILQTAGYSKREDGTAWRLDTIYRTNMQSAYMAGRYKEMEEVQDVFPYWQYISVMDTRTTTLCNSLSNKIVEANSPFWATHYPPNHFRCRARVRAVDDNFLKKKKLQVSNGEELAKKYKTGAGFQTNPAKAWKPDLNVYDKGIEKELRKELEKIVKTKDEIRKERLFSNCSEKEFEKDWSTEERKALQELIGKDRRLSKKQIIEVFGGRDNVDFGQIVVEANYLSDGNIASVNIRSMKGTGRDGTFDRKFILTRQYVDHSYYKLYETGNDAYKQAFINQLDFYEYLGSKKVKKIVLHANIDVGCWAWGRYGFKLNSDSDFLQYTTSKIIKEFKIRNKAEKLDVTNIFSKDKYFFVAAVEFCQKYKINLEDFKEKVVSKHIDWFGYFDLTDTEQQQIGRDYAKKEK